MHLLTNKAKFTTETGDLRSTHTAVIRPVLEQSSLVWLISLTAKNSKYSKRLQNAAVWLIMGRRHVNYKTSL